MPEKEKNDLANLPYPADEDLVYYQAECDSGYQEFWLDIRSVASAYLNNSKYDYVEAKAKDYIIMGEGIFTGYIEVETPDFILELKMHRPNKSRGRKSIWQVVEVKEKPWPTQNSESVQ